MFDVMSEKDQIQRPLTVRANHCVQEEVLSRRAVIKKGNGKIEPFCRVVGS